MSETITATLRPVSFLDFLSDGLCGTVGVFWQQGYVSFSLYVGSVDACVCADEAVFGFCYEVAVAHAHDAF